MAGGRPKHWTPERIKEALRELADENGFVTYRQAGIGGLRAASEREFGSWRAACNAAGVKARPSGKPKGASKA